MRIARIEAASVKTAGSEAGLPEGKTFGQFLAEAFDEVNDLQLKAKQASLDLALGKIDDVSQVAIASEKAEISLQLAMQIRNKALDAYQEIMRMQV